MIIPTPEYDPMYADDGTPFQEKMVDYIAREFGDMLGPRLTLLRDQQGLDMLATVYLNPTSKSPQQRHAA